MEPTQKQADRRRITGIVRQFAACFTDHRDPHRIESRRAGIEELIDQRAYGLCLGYAERD